LRKKFFGSLKRFESVNEFVRRGRRRSFWGQFINEMKTAGRLGGIWLESLGGWWKFHEF
jgi:hypothetical protein